MMTLCAAAIISSVLFIVKILWVFRQKNRQAVAYKIGNARIELVVNKSRWERGQCGSLFEEYVRIAEKNMRDVMAGKELSREHACELRDETLQIFIKELKKKLDGLKFAGAVYSYTIKEQITDDRN
ncbi:MAG: hypothetical protein Q4E34_04595 [Synergistaceae bacterium]|nr:hypothetical protein [Synergistaceae bacterium]